MSLSGSRISKVFAWEALDSRGRPTIACEVTLEHGVSGQVVVPAGASAGTHEVYELRDGDARFRGYGVRRAIAALNEELSGAVKGMNVHEHSLIDEALRGVVRTLGIENIGGNATLGVSLASVVAAANADKVSLARYLAGPGTLRLPMPMVNIASGGAHANSAVDIQDFLVVPIAATTFAKAIEWSQRIREQARDIALAKGFDNAPLVADEGGIGVRFPSNEAVLELLVDAIDAAGLTPGDEVSVAIDAAASEFFDGCHYHFANERRKFRAPELLEVYASWVSKYPIVSIEDPFAEDDWAAWSLAYKKLSTNIDLVGDDLFVTQRDRLEKGIRDKVANSILVKVNQNGLFTATSAVVEMAQAHGMRTVVSARSGDTEDAWLADLAVGWDSQQIKVGSTHRSERTSKWNRLLKFEATEETVLADPWRARTSGTSN